MFWILVVNRFTQIFQKKKPDSLLTILGDRTVKRSRHHTEGQPISSAEVQNLVARATWRPGFFHPWWGGYLFFHNSLTDMHVRLP
jgi:hypothetical protein